MNYKKVFINIFLIYLVSFLYSDVLFDKIYFSLDDLHSYSTIMLVIDPNTGAILERSEGARVFYGYKELIGMNIMDINTLTPEEIKKEMNNARTEKRNFFRFKHRLANGDIRDVQVNSYPMYFHNKPILLSRVRDVSDEVRLDEVRGVLVFLIISFLSAIVIIISILLVKIREGKKKIEKDLSEKETLLEEIHHRIKNNIISIETILLIQAEKVKGSAAFSALQDAISRIQSMRVLYETMLAAKDYRENSVSCYIEALVNAILPIFPNRDKVIIKKDIMDFPLSAKKLLFVGIIINELITNIMKHAFKERDHGEIELSLHRNDGRAVLIIQDNGVGMPSGFDLDKSQGFGITIVRMLSEQLHGDYNIEVKNGTKSTIVFDAS